MKKLPIGIQSIQKILGKGEYVYVDKTGFIKKLLDEGTPYYFMSRPRRFGKSLFLDTLGEIFKGNKNLFKECQIYHSDYDWKKYPVLRFDFSRIDHSSCERFTNGLKAVIEKMSAKHEISAEGPSIQFQLEVLIETLAKKNHVAVLVDKYDSPIINHLKTPEIAEQNRDILKGFFTTLKSLDRHLKFTFATGVSKFSQVSLFSGPNNLTDITMNPKYATMMGYTEEELKNSFSDHIDDLVKKRKEKRGEVVLGEDILSEIRDWYNGYRFSEEELSVYNPYSTLRFFNEGKVKGYWYSTGTPSFLIDEVKKRPQAIISLKETKALESMLSDISKIDRISLPALMFQTGYLTITDYEMDTQAYCLDFPNREVKQAFFDSLIQEFTEESPLDLSRDAREVKNDLETCNLEAFVKKMNMHFAKIAYSVFSDAKEGFYQAVFFTFLEKSGITTITEMATNIGRIDLVSELDQMICIFELKLNQTAAIAMTQAETKKYRERFSQSGKPTLVMGINFSSTSRNIGDWEGAVFSSDGDLQRRLPS